MRRLARGALPFAIASLTLQPAPAVACGGCFGPPGTFTAVDSHRMVMSLGVDETVLWDQFIYSGEPQDFAWVLPVPSPDVVVEVAGEKFVGTIDVETAPLVRPSTAECTASSAGGCGLGEGPALDDTGSVVVPGVEVYDRGVVGPYDTSVIGADDPQAMYSWLQANGYAFPDSALPVLEHYIDLGSAFVALRMAPGQAVSAMTPVRVTMKGALRSFPMHMMKVGAAGALELSLWVFAEQRYAPMNYAHGTIDASRLVWDWATSSSNYADVFDGAISELGGRAWMTEYAGSLSQGSLVTTLARDATDDYQIVLRHNAYPYLTRLRTRMLVDDMDEDLALGPAPSASDVSRDLVAGQSINASCDGDMGLAALRGPRGDGPPVLPFALALLGMAALGRVRARRAIAYGALSVATTDGRKRFSRRRRAT